MSLLSILAGTALYNAPAFLVCADRPEASDVVVLFLTDDYKTRLLEAEKLLYEGYSRYLFIPALGEIHEVPSNGKVKLLISNSPIERAINDLRRDRGYRNCYENTHVEALEAKRVMDERGFKSAIMVSSPYHMRRIGLIAGQVFKGRSFRICRVPTSFERSFSPETWFDKYGRGILIREYVKLGWFCLYKNFC